MAYNKEFFKNYSENKSKEIEYQIIQEYSYLVRFICNKFRSRGEPVEDLYQVGMIGLMKAIDNYNSDFDTEFTTYATPMIVGEIKHYFRDNTRIVRLPRRMHELSLKIKRIIYEFAQVHQKSPTIAEISQALNVSEEEIIEAMEATDASKTLSLDSPAILIDRSGDISSQAEASIIDSLGVDTSSQKLLDREALRVAIKLNLEPREQRIIYMRFYDNLSQVEIATYMNISQMHVSRIIRTALTKLQDCLFK